CRLGDPETQPILMRLRSDLMQLCLDALGDGLDQQQADWDNRVALGVVLAAGGYPGAYGRGDIITGLESSPSQESKVFHAGTRRDAGNIVTDGGRVLCVTSLGRDVVEARDRSYAASRKIDFRDAFFRSDIGYRAIARR
ncbi:MAG: phosphoribosylglycinamide synthetase C domain-containing protein, partial [Thiohalocapsa sp.]